MHGCSYPVKHVSVFGSTARNDDVVSSDLLNQKTEPNLTMFHIGGLKIKLEQLLHVPVDVLTIDDLRGVSPFRCIPLRLLI